MDSIKDFQCLKCYYFFSLTKDFLLIIIHLYLYCKTYCFIWSFIRSLKCHKNLALFYNKLYLSIILYVRLKHGLAYRVKHLKKKYLKLFSKNVGKFWTESQSAHWFLLPNVTQHDKIDAEINIARQSLSHDELSQAQSSSKGAVITVM